MSQWPDISTDRLKYGINGVDDILQYEYEVLVS